MKKLILLLITSVSTILYSQDTIDTTHISLDEITIQGVRADLKTPVSQRTFSKKEIDNLYHSQEVPMLLNTTPNVTSSSDGGHNMGYTYFRLRGIDQTRVNMTLDGVPLNEPEDQGVYFSNYPDFTNSIQSMQIQRGVGTSSNGVSSYAGSINFESSNGFKKGTETQVGYGSFNSYRISVENETGLSDKRISFYSRFSTYSSDGYRYNSGGKGHSFFLSGGYYGDKDIIKVTAFSGHSMNQMAWLAVSEYDINNDPRTNYNTEKENDDFTQSMIILKHKHIFKKSSITTSAFYNRLDGRWSLDLSTIDTVSDVLNFMLNSNFGGLISNYNLTRDRFRLNLGISGNMYERHHSMSILPSYDKIYNNVGYKSEASSYLKMGYDIGKISLFGDAQIRFASFRYVGDITIPTFNWIFFNPKGGLVFNYNKKSNIYLSVGQSHREPTRTDIFYGNDNPTSYKKVVPESVIDVELGTNIDLDRLKIQGNIYYMDFKNEITLLGALGYNGLPLMVNVDNSFRSGLETDIRFRVISKKRVNLTIVNTSSFSYNKIRDIYSNFTPLYTPNVIINTSLVVSNKSDKLRLSIDTKYHSKSYINWENTLTTPSFFIMNAQVDYTFLKDYSISVRLNNLTNKKYFTNGYAFGTDRYFFINPPFNFFVTIKASL